MSRLVWFRSDLRISDNTALTEACSKSYDGEINAVFFVSLKQWQAHDWGEPKIAFVLRCLEALKRNLSEIGIQLFIVRRESFDEIPEALCSIASELGADSIYANHEYEVNERKRDELCREALALKSISLELFHDQTCLPPADDALRTGAGKPYTVFSPFKKTWIKQVNERGLPPVRKKPAKRQAKSISVTIAGLIDSVRELSVNIDLFAEEWAGGEKAALDSLKRFSSGAITDYGTDRDFPNTPGTSRISPYLAIGAVSPRKCLAYAVRANSGELTLERNGEMVWASELIWREFYRHVLISHPRVCKGRAFKEDVDHGVEWRYDQADFQAWCEGKTGYPIVDAAMRQLNTTGWMHNRLRMVVAMFLTKHLLIDWRMGEQYFMQRLVDGDFASNNGGWQWSSSTGTDAQPYFRIFNPYSQSEKFDKEGAFIKRFCPELKPLTGKGIHQPEEKLLRELSYPAPIVEHKFGRQRALDAFKRG